MDDVVVQRVGDDHQVADVLRIQRDFEPERVFHRAHRGDRVHRRAHAADALHEHPRLARVPSLDDRFQAAPHRARGPCIGHRAVVHLDINAKVALNPRHGVNRDCLAHPGFSCERC